MPPTTTTIPPTPKTRPTDAVIAFRARKRAEREEKFRRELEARVLNQRWPISRNLRSNVINVALRLCGLKIGDDGHVQKTGETPEPPRVQLAALRVLASYDKLSIDQRKLDLKQYPPAGERPLPSQDEPLPQVSSEVATKCLMQLVNSAPAFPNYPCKPEPEPAPKEPPERNLKADLSNPRWPIALDVRAALIETAAGLCGLATQEDGTVEETPLADDSPQTKRTVVGALRVIARFDRLSLEHRRVELAYRDPESDRRRNQVDPEVAVQFYNMLEAELAAEEAARAGPDA